MYDEPVAVPIIDLLDSSMMSQYISAAREQYNQAVQDQKEFAKEFGDLYSPSASLNKAYYDQTKGRVNAGLNYLYQNGIDPLRSAEVELIQPRLLERHLMIRYLNGNLTLKI